MAGSASYTTVVVGLDGSAGAFAAVDRAAGTARRDGAALLVVCAYHPLSAREQAAVTTGLGDTRLRVTGTQAAQSVLDAGVQRARAAGADRVEGRLVESDAVEALLLVARTAPADLVVVGDHGSGGIAARLLGSVPTALVQRAPCDVLVVRAADD